MENQIKSNVCNEEMSERDVNQLDESMDNIRHLETISNDWLNFLDNTVEGLDSKLNQLIETIKQNNEMIEEIETKRNKTLNDIILKLSDYVVIEDINHLMAKDLNEEVSRMKTCVDGMSSELMSKKQHKTELTNKTKSLTKHLEEMESNVKELKKQQNDGNDEYMTLAAVMRVMYKTWNNSKVIGLLFNDNEEKSLERLIVIDKDNKNEQQMSEEFWQSLNNHYHIQT